MKSHVETIEDIKIYRRPSKGKFKYYYFTRLGIITKSQFIGELRSKIKGSNIKNNKQNIGAYLKGVANIFTKGGKKK